MIKGIKSFFDKKIKELNIKVLQDIGSTRSFRVVGIMKEKKVIFKLRRLRRFYSILNLKTEILTGKILARKELDGKPFQIRDIISYGMDYPQWVVFRYQEGRSAVGEKCKHWCFSKDFYALNSPKKMFELLRFWQDNITDFISAHSKDFPYRFKKYNFARIHGDFVNAGKFYLDVYIKKNPELRKVFSREDSMKGGRVLRKFRNIIEENNNCVSHGDMNPWNFLIHGGKTAVIDYETSHIDIPYVDLAFIWSASWNNLKWREALRKLFLSEARDKNLFEILFNLNLARFLPKVFGNIKKVEGNEKNLNIALDILKDDYQRAIKFLEKTESCAPID